MDSDMADEASVVCLWEEDVPGANLGGREVAALKVAELMCWLQCRRASVKGKKADLVAGYGNHASLWHCFCRKKYILEFLSIVHCNVKVF